jgi:hypothetical protein
MKSNSYSRASTELLDDMTAAQQRIFAVLADPANMGKSDLALIKLAKVSSETWYRVISSPAFAAKRREAIRAMFGDVSKQFKALLESAGNSRATSATDRKTLFTLLGLMPDSRMEVKHTGPVDVNVNLMPLSQMLWLYLHLKFPVERWMPTVRDQYEAGVLQPEMPPLPQIRGSRNPFDGPDMLEEKDRAD